MMNKLKSGIDWRFRRLEAEFQGYSNFPWLNLALSSLSKNNNKARLAVAGKRRGALGGPQTKLIEMERSIQHQNRPNVLFITSGSPPPLAALSWAKLCGVKILLNQNGVYYPAVNQSYRKINSGLRKVHDLADYVVYQTEFCKAAYKRWAGPLAKRHSVLWNGVDTKRFHPTSGIPTDADALKILIAGNIVSETAYQLDTLPTLLSILANEGFSTFKRCQFQFAGKVDDGSSQKLRELEKQFNDAHPKVEFKLRGMYSSSEAPSIYQQADMFLHLKYKDPCPNAVAEAMASGLPVLCGNSGGTPELVGESGFILQIDDDWNQDHALPAAEVAKVLLSLTCDEIKTRAALARQRAARFMDLNTWVKTHLELAETIL